jgi:hypothetical protein
MSKSERIVAAVKAHNKDPELSLTKLSKIYKINRQTLTNHIAEKNSTAIDYGVTKQRLTLAKKAILAETIQLAY